MYELDFEDFEALRGENCRQLVTLGKRDATLTQRCISVLGRRRARACSSGAPTLPCGYHPALALEEKQ